MSYLGTLGVALGEFELGQTVTFVGIAVTQDVFEVVYTGTAHLRSTQSVIELFYLPFPWLRLTQDVWEIIYVRPPALNLTQDAWELLDNYSPHIHLTQLTFESLHNYNPLLRSTQQTIEILITETPTTRFTQDAIEVFYSYTEPLNRYYTHSLNLIQTIAHSSIINRTVISEITVTPYLAGGSIPLSVTSNITVASVVADYEPDKHISITSSITVTQTISELGGRTYFLSVNDNVLVNSAITERTSFVFEAVTSGITVAATVAETIDHSSGRTITLSVEDDIAVAQTLVETNSTVYLSVTSNITVDQTLAFRNTVVRISIQSSIGATQTTGEREGINRQTVESDVSIGSIVDGHGDVSRQSMTSAVTVIDTINYLTSFVFLDVLSFINVEQTIAAFNPNYSITTNIHITPTISFRSTSVAQEIISTVTVNDTVRTNSITQSVEDSVQVYSGGYTQMVAFRIVPVRLTINDYIVVTEEATGGIQIRFIAIQDNIAVTTTTRHNFPTASVTDTIIAVDAIATNFPRNVQTVISAITVTPTIAPYSAINHQFVFDQMYVTPTAFAKTPITPVSYTDSMRVIQEVDFRLLSGMRILDHIYLNDTISARFPLNRQFITDTVTVSDYPTAHVTPNRQTLTDNITITERMQQLEITLEDRILVGQDLNLTFDRTIQQRLPITQTLSVNRDVSQQVTNEISLTQVVSANHDYVRVIVQTLEIPETDYLVPLDFHRNPLVVPVAIGVIILPFIMTLSGPGGAIQLPAAQLGDSVSDLNKLELKKAMDGTTRSYIQQVDRKKLVYNLRIGHIKAAEFRAFIVVNMSSLLSLINWKGEIWSVKITKNPFEMTNEGVWAGGDKESVTIELEMEGKQIA